MTAMTATTTKSAKSATTATSALPVLSSVLSILILSAESQGAGAKPASEHGRRNAIIAQANASLDLRASALTTLAMPALADEHAGLPAEIVMQMTLPAEFHNADDIHPNNPQPGAMTIRLSPHSVRAAGFEVLSQLDDGTWAVHDPGPVRTMRGVVDGHPGMTVAMTLLSDGLVGTILDDDGTRMFVQPASTISPQARANEHLVYRASDILETPDACGATELHHIDVFPPGVNRHDAATGGGGGGSVSCAAIACDTDYEYFLDYGSVGATQARIESVINTINVQYEAQVSIRHEISTILVRSSASDPYSSNAAGTLLEQMRTEWNTNQSGIVRDIAHLFTGKDLTSPTIGVAWVGAICSSTINGYGYGLAESDFNNNFGCATDLSAHEIGHNWSAQHCSCPSNTMNPSITCANSFSAATIDTITAYRNSRVCLDACAGTETGTTSLPFSDTFNSGSINDSRWTGVQGAVLSTDGLNEPSGSTSLNISGQAQIRSAIMDLSAAPAATLTYAWQRTGGGNSTETGEDLVVEYNTAATTWATLATHTGAGADMTTFTTNTIELPAGALHSEFRLRLRSLAGTPDADDWFIDDVEVTVGAPVSDCVGDCAPQGGNGMVDVNDVIELINSFGFTTGMCDISPVNPDGSIGDGMVNIDDLMTMMNNFGACP
jgi:hypothetical protein